MIAPAMIIAWAPVKFTFLTAVAFGAAVFVKKSYNMVVSAFRPKEDMTKDASTGINAIQATSEADAIIEPERHLDLEKLMAPEVKSLKYAFMNLRTVLMAHTDADVLEKLLLILNGCEGLIEENNRLIEDPSKTQGFRKITYNTWSFVQDNGAATKLITELLQLKPDLGPEWADQVRPVIQDLKEAYRDYFEINKPIAKESYQDVYLQMRAQAALDIRLQSSTRPNVAATQPLNEGKANSLHHKH